MTKPPEQPNEQWLDAAIEQFVQDYDGDMHNIYARVDSGEIEIDEQVELSYKSWRKHIKVAKSAILKHTRSVEAIEAAIGEDEIDFPKNRYNYWTYPKVRNRLRAEIRAALGLGEQDV